MEVERSSAHRLRRDVGLIGLLFTSLGGIIGSGWLFASLYAANDAGPASLFSWAIAGAALALLALIHAELGGLFPLAGASGRFPHFAYGSLVGFAISWTSWIAFVATPAIEVEAALQYATNYISGLSITPAHAAAVLTPLGFGVAILLLIFFAVVNILGVRWLARTNNIIVAWKVAIPVITAIILLIGFFHPGNLTAHGGFAPFGLQGVLAGLAGGGVVFALEGFEQSMQLAGEGRNPQRNVPIAVIASIVIGVIIYMLLQLSFLGALDPRDLAQGWSKLGPTGNAGIAFGPFAGLAAGLGLGWLAVLLYIDAFVSPAGTGLVYFASSSRMAFGASRNGYVPTVFEYLSKRGVPVFSVALSVVVGAILLLPFPGWHSLVGFITAAYVLSYAAAPLALSALRRQLPDRTRPYRLPAAQILCPLGFIVANLIIYWTGWDTDWKVFLTMLLGFILLALFGFFKANPKRPHLDWGSALWLWPYLAGMAIISYLGAFPATHHGIIPFGLWDTGVVVLFSLVIYYLAMRVKLVPEVTKEYVEQQEA